MKTLTPLLSICAVILFITYLSSCSPVPYANVGQNVPMFRNKGEVSFTGGLGSTEDAQGVGLQAAVAADSSLALIASFYSLKNNDNTDWTGSGSYIEFGAGRYGVINKSICIYDVFGGIGFGGIKNQSGSSSLDIKFMKPFVQGSIGITSKWMDVAFTPRFALPIYTSYKNQLTDPEQRMQAEAFFKESKSQFVFEPGVTLRFGYKGVKANLGFCVSTFSLDEQYSDVSTNNTYLTAGLAFLISKRYEDN